MKHFKSLLIALIILANFVFAQPSFADKPKFLKNPDYIEVTQNLNNLKTAKDTQTQAENYSPEELQKKIDELEFQKYVLETGINWGQCRNETGKILAVYGPKPDVEDDDYNYSYNNGLYFLADAQTTKKKWDCNGVYLPSDAKTTVNSQEVGGPIAIKILDGSQLVVKTNPDTSVLEFSIPPTQVFKTGEINWFIPNVSQSAIDTRVANAPTDKVVIKKTEQNSVESTVFPQTQKPPISPKEGFVYKR